MKLIKKHIRSIISVLIVMIPTILFGAFGMIAQMSVILIAGFISATLINIDKFDSFKAGNIEAKLKKASEVIDEATATINQLKTVTEPLLKSNLILLLHDGSFDGMGIKEKESTFIELKKTNDVLQLDSVNDHIEKAAKGVANHHFHELYRCVNSELFDQKFKKYTTVDFSPETPSVKDLEDFFEENHGAMNYEVEQKFNNFKSFKENYLK